MISIFLYYYRVLTLLNENVAVDIDENIDPDFEEIFPDAEMQPQPDGVQRYDDGMGAITEITYKDGKKNGPMKVMQDGRLTLEMTFVNDALNGVMLSYFPNGSIQMKMLFENDKLNGESFNYHPNGIVSMKSLYIDGKKQNLCQCMDDAGVLIQDSYYKDDLLHGAVTTYHEGEMVARSFYENGVEIKEEENDDSEKTSIWG
jgi:antitoxin component YwqK of YwqJK toxin-antitoxin module